MIPEETVQKIKDRAKLRDFVSDTTKHGRTHYIECPNCKASGKKKGKPQGVQFNFSKEIGKCFQCGFGFQGAIGYLTKVKNLEYVKALEEIAQNYGIDLEPDKERKQRLKDAKRREKQKSFRDLQLKESGLTLDDVKATIIRDDKTEINRPVFREGTRDQYLRVQEGKGDDMLIEYIDLDGKPVEYKKPRTEKFFPMVRVRWQNPDAHPDKSGRPIKYSSPSGSGTHLYIPQKIRDLYKQGRTIETLFLQEGEKKAEKACKHGIHSVGVMGIQNIGKDLQLPPDLQLIIQGCNVTNIVFLLDSDWKKLSSNLKIGDKVDLRPRSFFWAVKNYKDYMRTLVNANISIEIFFGYIRENEKNDKGIDDLLVNTLKGKEGLLKEDITHAMHAKNGEAGFVEIHKITMLSDDRLADMWHLNDREKFVEAHRKELEGLKEFKIGKLLYRFNEDGKLELAQPLLPSEQYWEENFKETSRGVRQTLEFNYVRCLNFLHNRGFFRLKMKSGQFDFVHIENKTVNKVTQYEIKDFVKDFTKELKREDVLNMIIKGGPQYLGYEKLTFLDFATPLFERATKSTQCLYFKNVIWEISSEGIKELPYNQLKKHVWQEKIIDFEVSTLEPLVKVKQLTEADRIKEGIKDLVPGEFILELTDQGKRSDFLVFLKNASQFTWKKQEKGEDITVEEALQNHRHLLNKLTAMGYVLHDYKNDSELKAVICMDGKMSEVGMSNGRTGKSLFGRAIQYVIPQVYIAAKSKKLTEDLFIFGEVTEKTQNIFLDDVRANVDFEFFFPLITGKLKVNPKGAQPYTLEGADTPKLLITTNHAINGSDTSTLDRQALVAFSDFYNEKRKPIDVSKRNFFSADWNQEQWNLFYNFMATCLVLYFQSLENKWGDRKGQGIVSPPLVSLEMRRLRQSIGEDLLTWAEEYFAPPSEPDGIENERLNARIVRREMSEDFFEKFPHTKKFITPSGFGRKIKDYCKYKGYHLNPHKLNSDSVGYKNWIEERPTESFIGEADKSGGVEYFTVADNEWRHKY